MPGLPKGDKVIYFLCGDDLYQKEKRLKVLTEKSDPMNTNIHTVFDFNKILGDVTTVPFLSDKKTVILKNTIDGKSRENLENHNTILDAVGDDCELIIVETKMPAANTKLAKKLKEVAKVLESNALKPFEIPNWIREKVKQLGGTISLPAANLLSFRAGTDLVGLENEIKKLITYNPTITEESIELLTPIQFNESVFVLIDAVGSKNIKKALNLLNEFLEDPGNEVYVLSMISKQINNMLAVKDLSLRKMSESQIVSETSLHPFVVKKTLVSVKNFSLEQLLTLHKELLNIDVGLKTGEGEAKIMLTRFLVLATK